ncbi:uncharacterized protein LOC141630439 [Silene latifolia]|uniref:uncharacterized protein LOC141630439 n=1 Tax=Silene latifolia TaxID=37657 RepID=UPI003D780522
MGKKQMARRTSPKKAMDGDKKGKGKIATQKGKEKEKSGISFRDPVDTQENEEIDGSEEISDESENSEEEEGSGQEEDMEDSDQEEEGSDEEDKHVKESEDGGLADALEKVVKMAAALGVKKKTQEESSVVNDSRKVAAVVERPKKMEVGQGSKRKLPEGAVVQKKKRQRKEGTKVKAVEGHGSPASLHYVIQHLSSAQRKDVEDIGFGGLLELKASKFIHTMVDWLLERYDTHTRLMLFNRFDRFSISKHDVYDVFMLPCGGEDVPTNNDDKELLHGWRERFGALPNKEIVLDKVRGEMLQLVEGGPEFKKMFVLFAMGSFLVPTVHNRVDTRLLGAVEDVLPYQRLDRLVYFHRMIWRGEPEARRLPLIQHWPYEAVKKRVKEECKAYTIHKGFGIGVLDLTTYPISLHLEKSFYRLPVEGLDHVPHPIRQEAARPRPRDVGLCLSHYQMTFLQMRICAVCTMTSCVRMKCHIKFCVLFSIMGDILAKHVKVDILIRNVTILMDCEHVTIIGASTEMVPDKEEPRVDFALTS